MRGTLATLFAPGEIGVSIGLEAALLQGINNLPQLGLGHVGHAGLARGHQLQAAPGVFVQAKLLAADMDHALQGDGGGHGSSASISRAMV